MISVLEIISKLIKDGCSVEAVRHEDAVYFDVHSGTKAFLHIASTCEDNKLKYVTRYDNGVLEVNDVEDAIHQITYTIRHECMCGRDFVSDFWMGKFLDYGIAEKVVKHEYVYK